MGLGEMTANIPQYGVEPPAATVEIPISTDAVIAGFKAEGAKKIFMKKDGEEVSVIAHFNEEVKTFTRTPDGMFLHTEKKGTPYPGSEGSTE